ncbi:MAG: 30S ribosomal protein S20 [Pseudomonadota bacterium]
MANHPSAKKRARQTLKKRERGRTVKGRMRTKIKEVTALMAGEKTEEAVKELRLAESAIARAASKGAIKKKKAARLTSRLSKKVNDMAKTKAKAT